MNFILEKESKNYDLMGGKATALSKLGQAIDNIPDWFVVSYKGFDIDKKEIEERLKDFNENECFAVRSSAGNEDSTDNSFAGQFETFLYVKKSDVLRENIRGLFISIFR